MIGVSSCICVIGVSSCICVIGVSSCICVLGVSSCICVLRVSSCICVLGVSILSLSTMFLLDFGTVPTVWYYFLSFHSMPTLHFELVRFYKIEVDTIIWLTVTEWRSVSQMTTYMSHLSWSQSCHFLINNLSPGLQQEKHDGCHQWNKSSTCINIRFSRLVNVTIWLLIEWFRSVWWK